MTHQAAVLAQASLRGAAEVSAQPSWAAAAGPSSIRSWGEAAQNWQPHGRRSLHSSAVTAALQPAPRSNEPPPHPWTQVREQEPKWTTESDDGSLRGSAWVAGNKSAGVRERWGRREPVHANAATHKEEDALQAGRIYHAGARSGITR